MENLDEITDEKPRVILNEYKITQVSVYFLFRTLLFDYNICLQSLATGPTVFTEPFHIKNFKKKCKIVIIRNENYELEFDFIGIHPAIANTFRRLMLSDVPSMAIEKVYVQNNTSVIQDEVLAHRLGLIPLKADPRLFEDTTEETEHDTLEFELKIKCSYNKEANKKDSSRVDDMYKNNNGKNVIVL